MFRQQIPRTGAPIRKMDRFIRVTRTSPHPSIKVPEKFKCLYKWEQMLTSFIYMTSNHWDEIWKTESIIQISDVMQRPGLLSESPAYQKMV